MKCNQALPCQTCKGTGPNYCPDNVRVSNEAADREFNCVYTGDSRRPSSCQAAPVDSTCTSSVDEEERSREQTAPHQREHDGWRGLSMPAHDVPSPKEETVDAQNMQTTGTEFYGNSSSFALLNQLLSHVRKVSINPVGSTLDTVQSPSSIVAMFYDEHTYLPDPMPPTPVTAAGRRSQSMTGQKTVPLTRVPAISVTSTWEANPNIHSEEQLSDSRDCFVGNPERLEREYVNLYFDNIYNIQPFLSKAEFTARCERDIWVTSSLKRLHPSQMHFMSLYNAVLSIAALTAGPDALRPFREELEDPPPSSLLLSKLYFWRARRLLGDMFEICSIESVQALLLMSIRCQYALRTHACYMYSGMALRTAFAIGLNHKKAGFTARMTWWAIYSQDIEASCVCGRLSILEDPSNYPPTFSQLPDESERTSGATSQGAITAALVESSAILQYASKRLYHDSGSLTIAEKSQIASDLDRRLVTWGSNLPALVNPQSESLDEPEWASKQKLHLQLRFYYTKMFIHRAFLNTSCQVQHGHLTACLEAAQNIITLLYNAYQHRHYLRTWWYNSFYTFHACLIVLFAMLLRSSDTHVDQLVQNVQQALKILRAMKDMKIAERSADLITEILNVVIGYVERTAESPSGDLPLPPILGQSLGSFSRNQADLYEEAASTAAISQEQSQDESYSYLLQHTLQGFYSPRDDILTCLADPNLVKNFVYRAESAYRMPFEQGDTHEE